MSDEKLREEILRTARESAKMADSPDALESKIREGSRMEQAMYVEYYSENVDKKYEGWVTFRRPGVQDTLRIGGLKTQILQGAGVRDVRLVDSSMHYYASVMAVLQVVVKKAPSWFPKDLLKGNFDDFDLLAYLFSLYEEWLDSFRKPSDAQDAEGNSETPETEADMADSETVRR